MNESTKIDWKKKLTSRKFWALGADVGMSIALLVYAIIEDGDVTAMIGSVILAVGGVIAYIIGEGIADASYNRSNTTHKDVHVGSFIDGNENDSNTVNERMEEGIATLRSLEGYITPDTTGRDGITIDGNEDI